MEIHHYVLGFQVSSPVDMHATVVLVGKERPARHKGAYNGPGGRIQAGESAGEAMARTFQRDTGVTTVPDDWRERIDLEIKDGEDPIVRLHVFSRFGNEEVRTCTDEKVVQVGVHEVFRRQLFLVPDVPWMLELILDPSLQGPIFMRRRRA